MTLPAPGQELLVSACAGLLAVVILLWATSRRRQERMLQATSPAVMRSLRLATGPGYQRRQPLAWSRRDDPASDREAEPVDLASPQTRALLLHIRGLETALEEQYAEHERIRKELAVELDDARRHDGARALTTVIALRPRLAGEPGDVAVARVEAALARLTAASAFSRPPLVVGATAGAAPPLAGPAAPSPRVEQGTEIDRDPGPEHATPQGAGSTTDLPPPVVLPVPLRVASVVATPTRRGRWRRRNAS